jgi:hypothetical protein
MGASRRNFLENAIALVCLATVVFLGWPILANYDPADTSQHCGCPASADKCTVPCSKCCDDTSTPQREPCPCENPTCR